MNIMQKLEEMHKPFPFNILFKLFKRYKNFIIFIIGGGVGALTNWSISFVLTSLLGLHYVVSYGLAQVINISVNFLWHTFITFKESSEPLKRFVKFIMLSLCTALLSIFLVYVTKEFILDNFYHIIVWKYDVNYLAAIIGITFIVSIINYVISKYWIFKKSL